MKLLRHESSLNVWRRVKNNTDAVSFGISLRGFFFNSSLMKPTVTFTIPHSTWHTGKPPHPRSRTLILPSHNHHRVVISPLVTLQAYVLYIYYLYNILSLSPFIRPTLPPPHTHTHPHAHTHKHCTDLSVESRSEAVFCPNVFVSTSGGTTQLSTVVWCSDCCGVICS